VANTRRSYGRAWPVEQTKIRWIPAPASQAIAQNDMLKPDGSGNYTPIAAGDIPVAVSEAKLASQTSAGTLFKADFDHAMLYWFPPDTGTVSASLRGKKMDTGGAQSIDIDSSTDGCIECVDVDIDRNLLLVRIDKQAGYAAV